MPNNISTEYYTLIISEGFYDLFPNQIWAEKW